MSSSLVVLGAIVAVLLLLLFWALHGSRRESPGPLSKGLKESGRSHVDFLPQLRQALKDEDDEFLARAGTGGLRGRVGRERRRVALSYLSGLRQDFEELMRIAKVIAALSPEVAVAQEFERLRLKVSFLWRYEIIRIGLQAGFTPLPQISDLSNLLSGFSVRVEEAMRELGERAADVAEMISAPDRRRIHPV